MTKLLCIWQESLNSVMDRIHIGKPHWEAGKVKIDNQGKVKSSRHSLIG